MCGRYTIWAQARAEWRDELNRYTENDFSDDNMHPQPVARYNAAPTQSLPIVTPAGLTEAAWGVGAAWSPGPIINATAEKLSGGFWGRMLRTRCLVPATGYYEWDKAKQPWYFTHAELPLICFAGLLDAGRFAIVTAPANADAAAVHHRMPVILLAEAAHAWLDGAVDPATAAGLALPLPAGVLRRRAVSKAVGNVRNDGPELILEAA